MFHHMAHTLATGGAIATLTQVNAVTDTVFAITSNSFIFTDDLQLLQAAGLGATLTRAVIYSPTLIPYGLVNLWPLNRALTPSSMPRVADFRNMPYPLPTNENIQSQATDTASEQVTVHWWVAPKDWNRNKKPGQWNATIQLTASVTTIANQWSGPTAVTFTNPPKGGWYAVNGAYVFEATTRAFRLYFPRARQLSGRVLRPGDLVSHTLGDMLYPGQGNGFGVWGAFHTFEPLSIELFGDAAATVTASIYLDVAYLGQGDAGSYPL